MIIHNRYQQYGGEDTVVDQEAALLKNAGHSVSFYFRSNNEVNNGLLKKLLLPVTMVWSLKTYRDISHLLRKDRPDVVHVHNTFFMISPAVFFACKRAKVPVVQSLYNPRLMCLGASLNRKGTVCEECINRRFPYPGILHKCYKKSFILSSFVATMLSIHKVVRTMNWGIDLYICATNFYRKKYIEAGLEPAKIRVKPHFVFPDPLCRISTPEDYAIFIGRLDPEKGVLTILEAWKSLKDITLKMRAAGQLMDDVLSQKDREHLPIELIKKQGKEALADLIKKARFLIFASEGLYETFGMVLIEAFSCGVPVISSKVGVMEEIVRDHETGLFFESGNSNDLAEKVRWAYNHKKEMVDMGKNARKEFEKKYTADGNSKMLIDIYHEAISTIAQASPRPENE